MLPTSSKLTRTPAAANVRSIAPPPATAEGLRDGYTMRMRVFSTSSGRRFFTCALLTTALVALLFLPSLSDAAVADQEPPSFPLMQPDEETFQEWMRAYDSAPQTTTSTLPMMRSTASEPGGSLILLSHIDYVPSERSQGSCGNCWAWAGTGCMEIALDLQEGIHDRLSVQYINSCQYDVIGKPCCNGGWLSDVERFYDATGLCIPWSNDGAHWQDADGSCTPCDIVSKEPYYDIGSIDALTIPTHANEGVASDSEAISNIKSVLDSGHGVWFAFFTPSYPAWYEFTSFWLYADADAVCDLDAICSGTGRGPGHAVLCVGYEESSTEDYWVMLNSWGTAGGNRPNGTFRVEMDMDYDTIFGGGYSFYWQTLDILYSLPPEIQVSPASLSCTMLQNQTESLGFTIGNTGEGDLHFDITDTEGGASGADCPWLSHSPTSGTVSPGGSTSISTEVDAGGLSAGDHEAEILVSSNDPASTVTSLPVTATVIAAPDLVPVILCPEWTDDSATGYNITLAVCNEGDGDAGPSTARLFIDGVEAASYDVPALLSGESFQTTFGPVTLSGDQDDLLVAVDTQDDVAPEGSESNNDLSRSLESPTTTQHALVLQPGWNMVSVPLILDEPSIATVFDGAEAVYTWDPTSKSYVIPDQIEPNIAYWVAVLEEVALSFEGLPVTRYVSDLTAGWHMLGSIHGSTAAFDDPRDAPPNSVEGFAYHWNPAAKAYASYTSLEPGEGYWVACNQPALLEVS